MIKKLVSSFIVGARIRDKIALFVLMFWFAIRYRLGIKNDRPYRVEVRKGMNRAEFFVTDGSDLGVLREIFVDEEYVLTGDVHPKVILDIGSNVGVSIVFFKLLYPQARVIGFEPHPTTFEKLKRNTAQFSDVRVFQVAISDRGGVVDFFVNQDSSMSSSLYPRRTNNLTIKIPSRTLSDVIASEGLDDVDLIKFDVEGAEFAIFTPAVVKDLTARRVIGEIHEDIAGKKTEDFMSLWRGWRVLKKKAVFPQRYILEMLQEKYDTIK